ncbi:hypothetical protein [Psychrobacter arcticus]|nr:hypothetical protein [Psychrobacter arcticus]
MTDNFILTNKLKYSQREVDFIFHNLELDGKISRYPHTLFNLKLAIDLEFKINIYERVYFFPTTTLVPDNYIRWLKDDLRATLWFYSFLILCCKWEFDIIMEHTVFPKDLILSFDLFHRAGNKNGFLCRDFLLFGKKNIMKNAIYFYNNFKTNHKYLSWLDRKDQEQMDWAFDYLQEKELLINTPTFLPNNTKECYAQVCASLDALDLHSDLKSKLIDIQTTKAKNTDKPDQTSEQGIHSQEEQLIARNEEFDQASKTNWQNPKAFATLVSKVNKDSDAKRELIQRMRTAWNQKVFRDKKIVKPEKKLKLPHGYEKKLNVIAEAYGENMVIYLKALIDKEYNEIKSKK